MAKKRKACCNSGNVNKKKKIQDEQKQNAMAVVDTYTSQLPDLVVYRILQVLPTKYAVRASILSKQWASVWSLVPVSDFDEGDERPSGDQDSRRRRTTFLNFLHKCLKSQSKDKQDLDKFKLRMRYNKTPKIIDNWLSLAVERNVKELDVILTLRTEFGLSGKYKLPHTILNAKSLSTLNLKNVNIGDRIGSLSLPSVKTMSLENMDLPDSRFTPLISGCSSIKYLSLTKCALWYVKVSSSSLKSLNITSCRKTSKVNSSHRFVGFKVEAMNLKSFRFCNNYWFHRSQVDIFSCRKLQNLEYLHTYFDDRWFGEGLDSRFPLLESLVLHECRKEGPVKINIDHQHLKHFVFCGPYNSIVKLINTPNLLTVKFSTPGSLPPHKVSDLLSNFSIDAPNLLHATINFNFRFVAKDFTPLINFMRNFDCSRKISLSVESTEALIFPEEMRKTCSPPLPSLKHLEVVINSPAAATDNSVLTDSLQWMAPTLGSLHINETEILTDIVL